MELKTLKDIGFSHIIAEEDINKVFEIIKKI